MDLLRRTVFVRRIFVVSDNNYERG